MVKVVNSSPELEKVRQEANLPITVLDFYADWCGPCRRLTPILIELSNKYEGKISIFKVNVDEAQDLCEEHNISCMPTIVFLVNGKVVEDMRVEGCDESQLVENIENCLKIVESISSQDIKVEEVKVEKKDESNNAEEQLNQVNKQIEELEKEINILTE